MLPLTRRAVAYGKSALEAVFAVRLHCSRLTAPPGNITASAVFFCFETMLPSQMSGLVGGATCIFDRAVHA